MLVPAAFELGCASATAPASSALHTETDRVRQLLPGVGSFDRAYWQARERRPRTCPDIGPMDYIYEGVVVLAPATVREYRTNSGWTPAVPEIAPVLRPFVPAGATWMGNDLLTERILGDRGSVAVDLDSGTLHFVYWSD